MPFVFSAIVTKVIVEIPLPPGKISVQLSALRDDLQTRLFIGDGPNSSEPDMSWIILVIAGLLEVVWAVGLKYTHGFSRLTPSVITVAAMIVSMALLAWAMKSLPVGTAYAVWTGIGAVGAAITGIVLLGESANPMRLASLALIVLGIIGLKLSTH
ncbi:SugE protein [Escherichia albertii B156]|nr:SugE protein [Escherichia albertii B156]